MKNRLTPLIDELTQGTVLEQWFRPLQAALNKVRYPEQVFNTLSMLAVTRLRGVIICRWLRVLRWKQFSMPVLCPVRVLSAIPMRAGLFALKVCAD